MGALDTLQALIDLTILWELYISECTGVEAFLQDHGHRVKSSDRPSPLSRLHVGSMSSSSYLDVLLNCSEALSELSLITEFCEVERSEQ